VRRVGIAGVALLLGLSGCGKEAPGDSPVQAQDFRFAPGTITVSAGSAVEWRNTGRTEHTIKGPGFFSRAVAPGGRWSHRFAAKGTFDYVCTLHPDTMRGRVVVSG
jgi:plastocyanin